MGKGWRRGSDERRRLIGLGLGLGLGRFVAWGEGDKIAMTMTWMMMKTVSVRRRLVKAWFVRGGERSPA